MSGRPDDDAGTIGAVDGEEIASLISQSGDPAETLTNVVHLVDQKVGVHVKMPKDIFRT